MAGGFIQKAVKHPGALTAAAEENGRSKLQEAEVEAHSNNPHIAARGRLGERFIKGDIHQDNMKAKKKSFGQRIAGR